MLQLCMDAPLPEETANFLRKAYTSAEYLQILMGDILDISLMEARKLVLKPTRVVIRELFDCCAALVAPKADEKGGSLTIEVDAGVPREMEGDANRLRQVIINFLSNGIKYSKRGNVRLRALRIPPGAEAPARLAGPARPAPRIEHAAPGRDMVHDQLFVEVQDDGIGIAETDFGRLFHLFRRASAP
eukprot:tig00021070_g17881.t1